MFRPARIGVKHSCLTTYNCYIRRSFLQEKNAENYKYFCPSYPEKSRQGRQNPRLKKRGLRGGGNEPKTRSPRARTGNSPRAPRRERGKAARKHHKRQAQARREGRRRPRARAETGETARRRRRRQQAGGTWRGWKHAERGRRAHKRNRAAGKRRPPAAERARRNREHDGRRAGRTNRRVEAGSATDGHAATGGRDRRNHSGDKPAESGGQRTRTGEANESRHGSTYAAAATSAAGTEETGTETAHREPERRTAQPQQAAGRRTAHRAANARAAEADANEATKTNPDRDRADERTNQDAAPQPTHDPATDEKKRTIADTPESKRHTQAAPRPTEAAKKPDAPPTPAPKRGHQRGGRPPARTTKNRRRRPPAPPAKTRGAGGRRTAADQSTARKSAATRLFAEQAATASKSGKRGGLLPSAGASDSGRRSETRQSKAMPKRFILAWLLARFRAWRQRGAQRNVTTRRRRFGGIAPRHEPYLTQATRWRQAATRAESRRAGRRSEARAHQF